MSSVFTFLKKSETIPPECDTDKFYDELTRAGVRFRTGIIDADFNREIVIDLADHGKFKAVIESWRLV